MILASRLAAAVAVAAAVVARLAAAAPMSVSAIGVVMLVECSSGRGNAAAAS